VSFGGKYNSFVLLATRGLGIKTFVSERSRPNISYGKLLDKVNPYMYKKATGIIAQTGFAKSLMAKKTGHKNIISISNPIPAIANTGLKKENIILNVGRFIKSKNQSLLVEYFAAVCEGDWKLVFLGDGQYLEATKQKAIELGIQNRVLFPGVVQDVESYYAQSKIFAFTSVSEGFPNALGEALSASLSCISFNCVAGPADLIVDGTNGFLVEELNHEEYKNKLKQLMTNESLRQQFETESKKHMEQFATEKICEQYLNFILAS
jgi:GalNAc-alpha-(1->4)-GalNAc-alpha-(1->3)-diNAcBac-PP-undecaprenol alpha-1,4-N-acetyl-D-galactosaminyltransferase